MERKTVKRIKLPTVHYLSTRMLDESGGWCVACGSEAYGLEELVIRGWIRER